MGGKGVDAVAASFKKSKLYRNRQVAIGARDPAQIAASTLARAAFAALHSLTRDQNRATAQFISEALGGQTVSEKTCLMLANVSLKKEKKN
jgi:hypothetical protein